MKKSITINFNLSNRAVYTLVTFLIIVIVGAGVYASSHGVSHNWDTEITNIPADFADGILSWTEITNKPSLTCINDNEVLKWDTTSGDWVCGTDAYNPGHGDGLNCNNGYYSKGVDANGNAQGCIKDEYCKIISIPCDSSSLESSSKTLVCPTTSFKLTNCIQFGN